jgi:Major Facilitator Superfamily
MAAANYLKPDPTGTIRAVCRPGGIPGTFWATIGAVTSPAASRHSRSQAPTTSLASPFSVAEFRILFAAQLGSLIGNQLARVALAVLVFDRSGSAALTGLVYALTYLPHLIGGGMASVADRYPRRQVMVTTDIARAALVGTMVIPGLPLWVLFTLVAVAELLAGPFDAARAAMLPDVLPGDDLYVAGTAVGQITAQSAQVVGFAVGGAVVALIGARSALGADAATFAFSAALVILGCTWRPATREKASTSGVRAWRADLTTGARMVFGDPRLRLLALFAWLCLFAVVPEGLAVPYAHHLGGGAATAGILLAAPPLGLVLGAFALTRFVNAANRLELLAPLALLSVAPLVAFVFRPGLPAATLLLVLSGVGGCYQLPANAAFVAALPNARRAQAFGLVASGMLAVQGIAIAIAGVCASAIAAADVIAGSGAAGCVVTVLLRVLNRRQGIWASSPA